MRPRGGESRGTYPRHARRGGLLRGVGVSEPISGKLAGRRAPGGDECTDGSGIVAKVLIQYGAVGKHTRLGQGDLGFECSNGLSVRRQKPRLCDAKCHSVFRSCRLVGT